MKAICNYEIFCQQSSTRIYELISSLFTEKDKHSEEQLQDLIERINNWALSHFHLKEDNARVDGIFDHYCRYHLDVDKNSLNELTIAAKEAESTDEKERLLVEWFEHSFVASEQRCKDCQFNAKNLSIHKA